MKEWTDKTTRQMLETNIPQIRTPKVTHTLTKRKEKKKRIKIRSINEERNQANK